MKAAIVLEMNAGAAAAVGLLEGAVHDLHVEAERVRVQPPALGQRQALSMPPSEKLQAEFLLHLRNGGRDRGRRYMASLCRQRDRTAVRDRDKVFQLAKGKAQGHGPRLPAARAAGKGVARRNRGRGGPWQGTVPPKS